MEEFIEVLDFLLPIYLLWKFFWYGIGKMAKQINDYGRKPAG